MREKIILTCFFTTLLIAAYVGLWFYVAKQLDRRIDQLYYVEAPQFGIDFISENSSQGVVGFPFWPYAGYTGEVTFPGGVSVNVRNMMIKPALFDRESFKIIFPRGISMEGLPSGEYASFDEVMLDIRFRGRFPLGLNKYFIQKWQNDAGEIEVKRLKILKQSLYPLSIEASGSVALTQSLQPFVVSKVKVLNPKGFLNYIFRDADWPTPVNKVVSMLGPMVEEDKKTGNFFIETKLEIKNGTLSIGSVPFVLVPDIEWEE